MKKSLRNFGILLISLFFCASVATAQTIGAGAVHGVIITCAGSASASPDIQSFSVSGTNLTGAFTATAPSGFEISLASASGYGSSLTLAKTNTPAFQGTVYVRASAAAPSGTISGSVTLSTAGAQAQLVAVAATVNALPGINTVADQTVANGDPITGIVFGGTANTFSWVNNTPSIGLAASGIGNIKAFAVKNPGSSALTATITVTPINAGYAYIPNLNSNNVSVINLATNLVVAALSTGSQPSQVSVSADGSKVYVINGGSATISVISTAKNTIATTFRAGSTPSGLAINPVNPMAYFANSVPDSVTVVNTNLYKIAARIPVGSRPGAMSISADGTRLYVVNTGSGSVSVINTQTNLVVATVNVGSAPAGIALSADGKKLYVANTSSNNISVINTTTNTVAATVSGGANPTGIALTPDDGNLYITNSSANTVTALNTQTYAVQTIQVGSAPAGISVSADGTSVYAANNKSNNVSVISTVSNTVIATINAGTGPSAFGNFIKNGSGCSGAPITFKIKATPGISKNADLANFTSNAVKFSPVFNAGVFTYNGSATFSTTSITITPTTYDQDATVKVNGVAVTSGVASPPIPLKVGYDTIKIVVTAQNGIAQKTYKAVVSRFSSNAFLSKLRLSNGVLSPSYSATTYGYTSTVGNAVEQVTILPTASDAGATITVNGKAVTSGSASAPVDLVAGNNISNLVSVVVKAPDGITTKAYNIYITRALSTNANLASIKLNTGSVSPAFSSANTKYTTNVANGITAIKMIPTTGDVSATVKVNGVAVTSGTSSAAIPLEVGDNTITATVTAQDKAVTKTYMLTVTRAASAVDELSLLKLSRGILSPVFSPTTTSYTAAVVNSVASVIFTPTALSTVATISINGQAIASGSASGTLALNTGANTFNIVVTAQDGTSTKTYHVVITRAGSSLNIPEEPVSDPSVSDVSFAGKTMPADDGVKVHQGLSPNGDGINDRLTIDGISEYPDNRLAIVNRNGSLVYEVKGYDNATKAFDGRSNKDGKMQLPGTYFYSLDYTANGVAKHKTGFFVLKY